MFFYSKNDSDHPEYAHRVLSDMGARAEDLVVGVTEGLICQFCE